jgi:hypothetical protein
MCKDHFRQNQVLWAWKLLMAISCLIMQANVHTSLLFLLRYPKTDKDINHFKYDYGHNKGKDHGCDDREELNPELPGISEEKTIGAVWIDMSAGKEARSQSTPNTPKPVDAYNIKGIIITKL